MPPRTLWARFRVSKAELDDLKQKAGTPGVSAYLRKLAGLDPVEETTFSSERQPVKRGNRYTKKKAQKSEDIA